MSFALKPINKSIQHKLEEKSKIFSRETSALNIQAAGGIPDALKDVQSRQPWMRWISGDMDPVVILGGVGMNDGGLGYSLAKGFKEVYVPPDTAYRDRMRYSPGQSRPVGPFFKPLAGVKSITTSFSGATKALRKTVITWTVFDLNELEILTPHFLSPGKWSMVEIGWNYDGKNFINLLGDKFFNVKKEGDTSPAQAELDRFEDFPEVDEIIYLNRGDYDVFSGIISNFEYSVREDGGFDCTTTLSNHGISLLDAGKDSTTFTVDTALTNVKVGKDPDFIAQLGQDNINIAIARLATYMRVQVTDDSNKLLTDMKVSNDGLPDDGTGNFYGPTPTNWFTYAGVKGKYVKKDDEVEFKGLESAGETAGMMTKDNPAASWVRWGWFEDNVLSRYVGYATMTTDKLGSIDGVDEIKLKFRSIDSVLVTDENDGVLGEKKKDEDGKVLKESVRILSHEKILTTDVNKFILIGKTPTLDKDEGVYGNLGKFLNAFLGTHTLANYKFQVPKEDSASEIEEGYIRNIFFNVRWLQEQFEGVGTLKEAIDNIWNAFNAEYQNYWQFDVVGDINDTTIARIVDTNNSRYSVDDYEISTINLKNPSNSRIGCYQFPTWTKDSIVSSMDYSVTIPSSQVAVAALSGGKLDSSKIAQRNRGNIDVQTFVKGMHKSFEDRKERFFDNITRIAEYAHVSEVATFGRSDGNENEKLEGNSGPNIIGKINERDPDLLHGVGGDMKESTLPKYVKVENTIVLSNAHKFLQTRDKSKPANMSDWPTLYENGAIQSSDKNVNYKRTMLGIMHTSPKESKGALTDLLNGIAEIKLTFDGTAGIFPGDAFTSAHLPRHLLRPLPGTTKTIDGKETGGKLPLLFQATNVEQALGPEGWKTTVTGQPRMNHKHVYQPTEEEAEQNTFREELRGEIVAGAVTKEGLLTRLFENRNILGINQQYLNYYQMFVGIRKVIDDEYFSPNGEGPRSTPFLDMRTEFGRSENKGKLELKVWVTKGSGRSVYTVLETQTHDERYTPALFKDINGLRTIEEAMRFAMYNGILYSMPHPKVHNSQYNPYTSIDGSYQCVSYNLFKGDNEGMNRWEAKAGDATHSTVPVYTRRYIDDMKRKLNEFQPTLSYTGKGSVEKWGIDGLYTPMAYIRRGKDVMKKFMRQSGTDIGEMATWGKWNEAKKWQQIIKVTTSNDGENLDTGYWDGVPDGPYKYKNIRINPDSYQIWFDYFKCMFNSYLGITWEERAQLVEHPTVQTPQGVAIDPREGVKYWDALKAAVWKSDETEKIHPKIGRNENERAELIAMMDNERMFKNGVAKFSVDNEIHKFLLHMKSTGFFIIPEVMWWKDYQSGADSESMDWMKLVAKRPGEWDKKYENKSGNASWELWPYESGGDGQKKLYYIDSTGKKISVDDR